MNVVIVIPAHNEEKTIANVIKKAKKYGKIIVVDDASTDKTNKIAKKLGAVVIRHKTNKGLGSSLQTGFQHALKMNYDVIITLDADGQHDPDDIPKFLNKINEGYDFVLGDRDLSRYPFVKRFGNFFLNLATNFISGTNVKDTESGFRALRKDTLKKLYLKAEKYEIAVEIIFEAGRNKLKIANVPVKSPLYVKGVGVIDGFKNFNYILKRRKRNWKNYIEDFKYVVRNWID
jgi:glycosyltransferase involved in cell wall biosynthesis